MKLPKICQDRFLVPPSALTVGRNKNDLTSPTVGQKTGAAHNLVHLLLYRYGTVPVVGISLKIRIRTF